MDTDELDRALRATLDDGRLSRAEREALGAVLSDAVRDEAQVAQIRARAFAIVAEKISDPSARALLGWAEDFVKLLARASDATTSAAASGPASRVFWSPGDACLRAIVGELGRTTRTADLCVFTITDDRISDAITAAHRRGVAVRIVTDNDKAHDEGSDVRRLARAGIAVRVDETEHHMHHKFAVLDRARLLNGSYNWTRSAAEHNEENVVLTEDAALVGAFAERFDRMWDALGPG